ncbi:hypothetical protein SAMN05444166_4157 [Singulisphaera sp. GP187]|uniref:hypothetical protein n=1 Tax=Singulisphaera sp. GP187 TaxID=1882752 RepID=UPI0009285556|nr:hypothetical protein [Singulisphaera sp. GP187]SIO36996.1 hypothetical protein SAMN05444166_4157 [Singulisphaera sp. GP187]
MQIELLIAKLKLIAARSPGYEVYVTMGGVCRDLKYGCQIYEYHQEKAVMIDPEESFLVELRRGNPPLTVGGRDDY